MINVSLYSNIKQSSGGEERSLSELMEEIRGGSWKEKVSQLREIARNGATKEEQEKIKSNLPYFTASGTFSKRVTDGLIKHTGKIAIDLDGLEDLEKTKAELKDDKYTEYLFTTCRGGGLCIIVNIDPARHLDSFLFLEKYYKRCYKLDIDKSCKDVTRARFVSYDEDLFHNPEYEVVYLDEDYTGANYTTIENDDEKYDWILPIHEKKETYSEGNRHNYLVKLAYFMNKVGISSDFAMMKLQSFQGDGKTGDELKRIHKAAYQDNDAHAKHGTFVINKKSQDMPAEIQGNTKKIYAYAHKVNEAGRVWTDADVTEQCTKHLVPEHLCRNIFQYVFEKFKHRHGLDEMSEIAQVEIFITDRWDIIENVVTNTTEFKRKGDGTYKSLRADDVFRELQHAGYNYSFDKIKSLLKSDYVERYNPFVEYFESLPEYGEDEIDYIDLLASHVKTENDEQWRIQFKKALVRSLACTIGGYENRIVPVLVETRQNTGKTNFIRFLAPDALKPYYTETMLDASKDSDIQLSENFIWNLEELSSLSAVDINKLKAIISKSKVKQRRAYATQYEQHPRRCNFWASTNKSGFLVDETNTRWLCFNVVSISHDYHNRETGVKNVNIDNVWAQAWHLYNTGFNYTLSVEEGNLRDKENRNHEITTPEKELILKHYQPSKPGTGDFFTNTDILLKLQDIADNKIKLNTHALARALSQLEYDSVVRKIGGRSVRGYWLQMRSTLSATGSVYDAQPGEETPEKEKKKKPF